MGFDNLKAAFEVGTWRVRSLVKCGYVIVERQRCVSERVVGRHGVDSVLNPEKLYHVVFPSTCPDMH